MVDKTKMKKYEYKDHFGKKRGYYTGYKRSHSDSIYETESKAIKDALKKMGGVEYIDEVRFYLDTKIFTKKNAFHEQCVGIIDNSTGRPIYEEIVSGKYLGNTYLLSKDGRRTKKIKR